MAYVNLLQVIYPVGSCYISFSATSPASIVGGSWSQIKSGLMMAIGSTGAATSAGGTGGSRKIAVTQLPAHTHDMPGTNHGTTVKDQYGYYPVWIDNDKASNWRTSPSSATGGGTDYIPAHFSVYIWRRTA